MNKLAACFLATAEMKSFNDTGHDVVRRTTQASVDCATFKHYEADNIIFFVQNLKHLSSNLKSCLLVIYINNKSLYRLNNK